MLGVRNKKSRACINERTFVRTNIWTYEHARGQTERQTDIRKDGLKHTSSRTRACKHTNACIGERKHARSNIWTHEQSRGQTDRQTNGQKDGLKYTPSRTRTNIWTHVPARGQTDRQTDGRTQTYALTHACMKTHENACIFERTHVRLKHFDARI